MATVYMDTDKVQSMADGFESAGDILRGVSKALEAAINILRATAFIGLVGGLAVERYLSIIKPKVDHLAEFCTEIHGDLEIAVQNYINGDEEGASRFY